MGQLLTNVRSRLAARQTVVLWAPGNVVGEEVIKFDKPKMFVLVRIEAPFFIGHFFSKEDLLFFPQDGCRIATTVEISATVDTPGGVLR